MPRPKGPGRRRDMTNRPSNDGHFWDVHRTTPGKQGGRAGGPKSASGNGCAVLILGALGMLGAIGTAVGGAIGGWWT